MSQLKFQTLRKFCKKDFSLLFVDNVDKWVFFYCIVVLTPYDGMERRGMVWYLWSEEKEKK